MHLVRTNVYIICWVSTYRKTLSVCFGLLLFCVGQMWYHVARQHTSIPLLSWYAIRCIVGDTSFAWHNLPGPAASPVNAHELCVNLGGKLLETQCCLDSRFRRFPASRLSRESNWSQRKFLPGSLMERELQAKVLYFFTFKPFQSKAKQQVGFEPGTFWSTVQYFNHSATLGVLCSGKIWMRLVQFNATTYCVCQLF